MRLRKTLILLLLAAAFAAAAAVLAPGAQAGSASAPAAHASQAAPEVSGTVFADDNTNGARDAGEPGLPGWTVFVDLHGTGVLAADDPQAVTASDGSYAITGVPAGTYLVRLVQQSGVSCTQLSGCLVMATFPASQTVVADFGETRQASPSLPPTGSPLPPGSPPGPPVFGKTFTSGVVSGIVLVKLPAGTKAAAVKGTGFVRLTEPRSLPVGTILDTTAGTARITTAVNTAGQTQSGDFGAGVFKVLQDRRQKGLTQLNLMLAAKAASACPRLGKARTAAKKLLPGSVIALLHANVKGRFRTRGRYSSGTVRGTMWDTVERCDGTLTRVSRGAVSVQDLRHRRTVLVRAGRSYLARP
jgi:hypothetical protein